MVKLALTTFVIAIAFFGIGNFDGSALVISGAHAAPKSQYTQWQPSEGADIIGTKAPEFAGLIWVNSKPLTMASLKGKPVFIRFWLGDCSYCQKSVPAINYLHKTYGPKGLVVIGIHHPKGATSLRVPDKVETVMHQWTMDASIPVALDNDWQTINRFWTGKPRDFTSASILIDGDGVIRWVHPGGTIDLPRRLGGRTASPAFESLQRALTNSYLYRNY